ncbi:MAG: M42 family metallopeptidase [Lachnospiraceae bacterium]|jgi:putative aminopeptidase FrvX|nr:M42 family metallopeptidase [Lachnospiraceae bacterium]
MDIQMFGRISDAFGPSGFEEDVIRVIAGYCGKYEVENDAMNNLYVRMPGADGNKPVIQLDAHTDECGFMVQTIHDNGVLGILMLGGFVLSNIPAHTVVIRTRSGKTVRGIITSKPVHFMNEKERASQDLDIEKMYVDIGAESRSEAEEVFGVSIGDPMMPEVSFSYDEEHEICLGKAFDNRAGCACIVDVMEQLYEERDKLPAQVVGAFAAQEEVGMRGAAVTAQVVKPDLAIVFEGSPSDDFYFSASQAQGRMKSGVQIRRMDKSYVSNPAFIEYAEELAKKYGIPYQETVRRGGSTNAGKISLTGKAVPVLVLGVPSRYVHTHYNFCAKKDLEAATALAVQVIRELDGERLRHILRQDVLEGSRF